MPPDVVEHCFETQRAHELSEHKVLLPIPRLLLGSLEGVSTDTLQHESGRDLAVCVVHDTPAWLLVHLSPCSRANVRCFIRAPTTSWSSRRLLRGS